MNELIDGQLKRNLKPIYFTNYQINEQCILIIYSTLYLDCTYATSDNDTVILSL